jgi:rubrerythrin
MTPKGAKGPSTPPLPIESMLMLDQCALIEQKCAELYHHFATLHPDLPELQALWKKTALEEENHAQQFKMLSRMKGEGIETVKADASKVAAVLKKLDSLFEQVQGSAVSPADTLRLGIKLESYLKEYHANSVAVSGTPEMARLLNAMMEMDMEHEAMLERALEKLLAGR